MIVKFKTAQLAKEKGFNLPCYTCYNNKEKLEPTYELNCIGCEGGIDFDEFFRDYNNTPSLEAYLKSELISAPTQSELQTWLRDKFNLKVLVDWGYGYEYKIVNFFKADGTYNSYEEALEEGLFEALKLI